MAQLDYNVITQPVLTTFNDNIVPVNGKVITMREDTGRQYDIVSSKYKVIQNADAFDFVNYIAGDMHFLKAGETTSHGTYLIGQLDEVKILGDSFTPHIIFRNSFDGHTPIQACICLLRIVCQNQFNMAFKSQSNNIRIKHSAMSEIKMKEAQTVLRDAANYIKEFEKQAEIFADTKVTAKNVDYITSLLFPIDEKATDRTANNVREAIARFKNCVNAYDNADYKGTLWALVNAYSDFITHEPIQRETSTAEENKFISVTCNPLALMNMIKIAQSVVGSRVA